MGFLSNKIWVRIFLGHPIFVKNLSASESFSNQSFFDIVRKLQITLCVAGVCIFNAKSQGSFEKLEKLRSKQFANDWKSQKRSS